MYNLIWLGVRVTRSFSNRPARSWSMYGKTMYTDSGSFSLLLTTNMSCMLMIQGCLRALRILISRRAVTGMPSFS